MKTTINPHHKNNFTRLNPRVKLTAFILAVFSALISVSGNPPVTPSKNVETEKTIQTYFRFPSILLPQLQHNTVQSRKVEVLFTTDKNGDVNFALAKTDDKVLKSEVETQFYRLRLPKLTTEVVHSVVLDFRTK